MLIAIVDVAVPILVGYLSEVVHVVLCWKREKDSVGSLLCSGLTNKSSFASLCDLEQVVVQQQPAFLCTLRDKKAAENKFPEFLQLIVGRVVKEKISVHNGFIYEKAKLITYTLCVLRNPAVKCCRKNTRVGEYTQPMSSLINRHVTWRLEFRATKARKQKSNTAAGLIPWTS